MRKQYFLETNTATHYPFASNGVVYSQNDEKSLEEFKKATALMTVHLQKANTWEAQNFGVHTTEDSTYYICHFWDGRFNRSGMPIFSTFGLCIGQREAKNFSLSDFASYFNQVKSLLKITHPGAHLTAFDLGEKLPVKWNNVVELGPDMIESEISKRPHYPPIVSPILKRVRFTTSWQDKCENVFVDLDVLEPHTESEK